jgi:hypothetical protein
VAGVIAALAVAACYAPALGASSPMGDPPQISHATMSPRRFPVPRGTTFQYQLSKKAKVFFFLDRGARGRAVGGHCRRQSPQNRHHRSCPFYVRSGSFSQQGMQGANMRYFNGRVSRRALKPAHYKATIVAVDGMGNPSTPGKVLRFTVLPG